MTEPKERSARARAAEGLARAFLGLSLALGPTLPAAAQRLDPPDLAGGVAPGVAVDAAPAADPPVDPCRPPYSDRDTACVLAQSADTYGYLDAGQFNVYRVDAPAPQPLKAELLDLASDLDLYLYDSGNQEWAESVQEDTTPEVVDVMLPRLETYYLYVVADAGRPIDPSLPYHLRVSLGAPLTTTAVVDTPPVPLSDGHDGKLPPELPPPAPNPPAAAVAASAPNCPGVVPPAVGAPPVAGSSAAASSGTASSSGSASSGSSSASGPSSSGSGSGSGSSTGASSGPTPPPVDTSQVSINLPGAVKVEATGPDGASVSYKVSVSDGAALDCSPGSGSTFPLGVSTVNCTATGPNGKQASGSFSVTVADTTPPSLKLPDPITSPAGGSPITFAVSATDLVDPSPSVACSPASGASFGVGKTSVGCTATDKAGNTSKGSFAVTVTDSAPPSLKLSGVPSGVSKSSVTITATATDPGGVKSITSSVGSNTTTVGGSSASVSISAEGTTSVSFTATDLNGNTTAPVGATVKIDKTAPVVHVPAPIDMEVASTATGANVSYTASASDNLDASPSLSCDHASGSRFGLGTTRVTCTATDSAGNSAAQSFTVTISRLEPPPRPAPCGLLADDPTGDPTAGPTADLQAAAIPNCPLRPV